MSWDPHDIQKHNNYQSPTFRTNIHKLCLKCHIDRKIIEEHKDLPDAEVYLKYEKSVHGLRISNGSTNKAATCTDCHNHHLIVFTKDSESPVAHKNVPQTCKKCHEYMFKVFMDRRG